MLQLDQNKPPGKVLEDGNDLPPLSQKEKSRRGRMLFVERVQAFQSVRSSRPASSPSRHAA